MNTPTYHYELIVHDDNDNVIYKRSTPFPHIVEQLVEDAKKAIEDFWNDKKSMGSKHDYIG